MFGLWYNTEYTEYNKIDRDRDQDHICIWIFNLSKAKLYYYVCTLRGFTHKINIGGTVVQWFLVFDGAQRDILHFVHDVSFDFSFLENLNQKQIKIHLFKNWV